MQYSMLLWPHANARYQNETMGLARAELTILLEALCPGAEIFPEAPALTEVSAPVALPAVRFASEKPLDARVVEAISRHSLLYALFEARTDGSLLPLTGRARPLLGSDLPGILKYKGKTNELFCQLLINVAYYAANRPENARLLDPLCGRGTTLFSAANLGLDATGSDVDKSDLREASAFFKRYLEYHRFKYSLKNTSRTLGGKNSAPQSEFAVQLPDRRTLSLRLCALDAACVREAFGRGRFHMIVADLPYGVQHSAGMPPEALLDRVLSGWREALCPGGSVAISFNSQTLPLDRVRGAMARAGFHPLSGGAYDAFSHWVEQAVTRDVAVAVRK